MLNRLYIVVGVLAILILAAAFVVPSLIPWGSYRGRMESLAAEALGAEVRVNGEIHFSLMPQPHMELADISVGPQAQPVMSVKSADADFSLMDFLRNRYSMTRLVLDHPVLNLTVEPDGTLDTGLKPAGADSSTALSVANAQVDVGSVQLNDTRSGRIYSLDGLNGQLSVGAIAGPFGFEGGGSFGDQHYAFHITTTTVDAAGNTHLSLFAKPDGEAFSISAEGALTTNGPPHFSGDLIYRQAPPAARNASGVIGDLTLTSKLDVTPAKLVLSAYTLIPDENRAVTRLTGQATLAFGATPMFSATVESGVLAMPPRDATAETGPQPYELVRMLGELPVLPVPPVAGHDRGRRVGARSAFVRAAQRDAAGDHRRHAMDGEGLFRAAAGQHQCRAERRPDLAGWTAGLFRDAVDRLGPAGPAGDAVAQARGRQSAVQPAGPLPVQGVAARPDHGADGRADDARRADAPADGAGQFRQGPAHRPVRAVQGSEREGQRRARRAGARFADGHERGRDLPRGRRVAVGGLRDAARARRAPARDRG